MEAPETDLGPQNVVTVCDEEISTDESEKVANEDQGIPSEELTSQSKSSAEVEAIPVIVHTQDGHGCDNNIQCSELDHESRLPVQLTAEIVNNISNVTEMSPVERRDAGENSEVILKSLSVSAAEENSEVILMSLSVSADDNCGASKLCETDCNDDHLLHCKAPVISKDQFKNTASQEGSSLSKKDESPTLPPVLHETDCNDDHILHCEAPVISQDQFKDTTSQEVSSLSQKDESPTLPSDLSEEINNSFQEDNASSQETIATLQEASIILQKAVDSVLESSISTQEASVSSQSHDVSSRESSPEVCVSSQETSASLQGTDVRKQETALDENIVKEKVLSCGLDLVCDNDSEEISFEDQAKSLRLANLNSSSGQDKQIVVNQKKRKKTREKVLPTCDKVPIASSTKPEWFKPFEDGWCREVVLRKEVVTSGVRPADIYYYTPNGKKLRSMPEICQHLKGNKYSLDTNCFTFSKCAIYKEPFETVRSAGEHGGKSAKSSPLLRSAMALKKSPSSSSSPVKKKLKTVAASSNTEDLQKKDLTNLPKKRPMPVEESQTNGIDTKRCKLVEKNFPQEVVQKLCGLNCPGAEGVAPNIPCDNCMCMFHASCIQFSATSTSFTCQTCQIQQRTSKVAAVVSSSAPLGIPSLRPITLHTTTKQRPTISGSRGPPPLQRANMSSRAPPSLVVAPTPVPPMMLPMHLIKPFCVTTSTYQPMHLAAPTNPPGGGVCVGSIPTAANLVQSTTILSQPTRQLRLVLPPKVVTQLNLEKPLALKINGQQLLLQPNEFIPIANGIKVLLPENLIAKSCPNIDPVNKSVAGTVRLNKSKAPTHGSAFDKGDVCIIECEPSPPPTTATKSSDVSTVPLIVPLSSENVNGKSLTQPLADTSTAKQLSEGVVEKCRSPDVVSSTVPSLGTGEENGLNTAQQISAAQMPLMPEKSNSVAHNSDVVGSQIESRPVVIRVDSDTESDSESPSLCEPPIDVSKVISSASCVSHLPPYVIVPVSPAAPATASTTPCQSTSSCGVSLVSFTVLGTTSTALTSQPLLPSCVVSYATSTVSSVLPMGSADGDSASDISEILPVTEPTSTSSVSMQTSEHLMSDPSANHSKDVTDSATRTDELSETVINRQINSVGSKRGAAFKRAWSNFGMLHAGFNAMFHIFQHLGVCDLLRAATVCKMWHKLTKDAELWRSIGFRGCRVKNWQQAVNHFQRMNTQRLDFRGMLQNDSGSCTWLGMAENLPRLSAMQQVDFGQCSAKVLSLAAEAFPNLRRVTAEIVTFNSSDSPSGSSCPEFDPAKLADLHELVCLKVRGVPGITLPTSSDAKILQDLGRLTQLQNLSLTTLRGIEGKDFSFIGSLSQLRVLELGNCLNWTKETFGNLAKLINLTNLRLECGGDPVDAGLGDALKKLTNLQHLELIRYFVADNLAIVFPTLTHLKSFFIWPELQENEAQVGRQNSIILSAVSGMPFLQRLFWGITIDSQSTAEDASSAVNRQTTIPFLLRGSSSVDQRTLSTRRLTIKEIVLALSDRLPNTEIRVFQVPAQSQQITSQ